MSRVTPIDLLRHAQEAELQGCAALAERLRTKAAAKAPHLPGMSDAELDRLAAGILAADLGTMSDEDLEKLAAVVAAEVLRREAATK